MATGPGPREIARYVARNGFEWIVFDARESALVRRLLADARLEEVARFDAAEDPSEQVLARIHHGS